ncbi:MAG: UDP binding domain-containing protein [Rhizobiaceae bacterium]
MTSGPSHCKANTDDIRLAVSTAIAPLLKKQGANVIGYDPETPEAARDAIDHIETTTNLDEALTGADAVIVLTEWDVIKSIDWAAKIQLMNMPVVVDLPNLYSPDYMKEIGMQFTSLGRPAG